MQHNGEIARVRMLSFDHEAVGAMVALTVPSEATMPNGQNCAAADRLYGEIVAETGLK